MTEQIAKIYAKAAFEYAEKAGNLADWTRFLEKAAGLFSDKTMQRILASGFHKQRELLDAFDHLVEGQSEPMNHLLWLMAERSRLAFLPQVSEAFLAEKYHHEGHLEGEVLSVIPLSEGQRLALSAELGKKMGANVTLSNAIDDSILGGLLIRLGDQVIDRSLKGQLNRLQKTMYKGV